MVQVGEVTKTFFLRSRQTPCQRMCFFKATWLNKCGETVRSPNRGLSFSEGQSYHKFVVARKDFDLKAHQKDGEIFVSPLLAAENHRLRNIQMVGVSPMISPEPFKCLLEAMKIPTRPICDHQTSHFLTGFMAVPRGQTKSRAKSGLFENGP